MTALLASLSMCRTSFAFVAKFNTRQNSLRLFSVSSAEINSGVSRVDTLQSLLSKHGAPGSKGCAEKGDLEPVFLESGESPETPELVSTLMGMDEFVNLHPHLYPLARSKKTGNVVCALRRAFADDNSGWYENSSSAPWPIVEATVGGPGMRLLSLNSENMMRRIVCECDFSGEGKELIDIYNDGLVKGEEPYEPGSVEKLG
jgi:hypothetical protein